MHIKSEQNNRGSEVSCEQSEQLSASNGVMRAVAKTLQGRRRRKIGKGGEGEGKGSPRENPFGRGGNADFCRILFFPLSHEGVPSFLPVRQHNKIPADNLSVNRLFAPSNHL